MAERRALRIVKQRAAAVLLGLPLAFSAFANPVPDARSVFQQLVADVEAFEREHDPITAGFEGDRAAWSRLPDLSPRAAARQREGLEALQRRAEAIEAAALSAEQQFDLAFLKRVLADRLERGKFDESRLAFSNEGGPVALLRYLASVTPIRSREDAEAWLARLAGAARLIDDSTSNARRGIKTGFVQPRITVETVLPQLRAELAVAIDEDPLLAPLKAMPAQIPEAERDALLTRGRELIEQQIRPAQARFVALLEKDYLRRARRALGVGSLPGGKPYYAYLARHYTTAALTPDEIHALGQSEVARIRAEMEAVIKESGFSGSFAEFLAFLRRDPRFYAKSRDELLEKAAWIAKRADDKLPGLFGTLPRLPYGVREVDRTIEANYTTGRYNPGSPQQGVAGGYMVNTSKLDQRPLYELPALTLHEAVPGHHLQIALAQELGELPYFRRNADVTAFVEGWGLYAELLGYDMGIYLTPYERFGKLSYEMWRACRLVADTGIHWLGWDLDQARACFAENSALAPHNIETELQRYISWPGQALAYKVGELKLRELRRRAETRLGERFDIRQFHDTVLLGGPMPLDMLEARVDVWIAEQSR